MTDIVSVNDTTHNGEDGFTVKWRFMGFTESGAKFRAVVMAAMRFPTTITEVEVLRVSEFGKRDYDVVVFIPTDGFPKAGVTNPIEWAREQFGERFRR